MIGFTGESIPIRLFLSPYELTPTHHNINNKFSVKYFLNLVLVDEEDRRYFKQQEITMYRLEETSWTIIILRMRIRFVDQWRRKIKCNVRCGNIRMSIGSDITSMVTLPVIIFEPMTMIQKMAEVCFITYVLCYICLVLFAFVQTILESVLYVESHSLWSTLTY